MRRQPKQHTPPRRRIPRWGVVVGIVVLGGLAGLVFRYGFLGGDRRTSNGPNDKPQPGTTPVKAPHEGSPYKNVHPDAKYVSDDRCADCHQEIYDDYFSMAMGRSLDPVAEADPIERYGPETNNPFTVGRFRYEVRREGDRMIHVESRLDSKGNVVSSQQFDVDYSVGSGVNARSYLISRDGFLFESPMTWFPRSQKWGLSPGYEEFNRRFTRGITQKCLFCHANQSYPVAGARNHYHDPVFDGHRIGCQRCHGPGAIHVEYHEQQGNGKKTDLSGEPADSKREIDYTIVNPTHLAPVERDAVCQQCHVSSFAQVDRRGRKMEDYRPGLALHEFVSMFYASPQVNPEAKFSSHSNQMQISRCYQASGRKLSCATCHDPHAPRPQNRIQHYRNSCLKCHQEDSCSMPPLDRRKKSPQDSCIQCHMPGGLTIQIQHTASTDHRILRSPAADEIKPTNKSTLPLIHFHQDFVDVKDPDIQRDFAIALMRASGKEPGYNKPQFLMTAGSILEAAVQRDATDFEAMITLALIWDRVGRSQQSHQLYRQLLEKKPQDEFTLYAAVKNAGNFPGSDPQYQERIAKRLLDTNPWDQDYWFEMARSYFRAGKVDQAIAACQGALAKFPDGIRLRMMLIGLHLHKNQRQQAERRYQELLKLDPENIESIKEQYRNHPLRKGK